MPAVLFPGVLQAVAAVNNQIKQELLGKDVTQQAELDSLMLKADGTEVTLTRQGWR